MIELGEDDGIGPVPTERRTLGVVDQTVLWGSLGVSLLTLAAGSQLVPALDLGQALLAILVGGALASAIIAAVAALGAAEGVPGMVLLRRALGVRGSAVPTVLNVAQNLGWSTFEIIIIAEAARQVVGGPRALWVVAAGLIGTALAVAGPRSVVRRLVRRIVAPLVAVSLVYVLARFVGDASLDAGGGGDISFLVAADVVVGLFVSWLPLAPDYTRYSRSPRAAALGAGVGYFVGAGLTLVIGVVATVAVGAGDVPTFIAAVLAAPLGLLVASVLVVDETEKAFANIYSTAVSLQNVAPRLARQVAAVGVGVLVTVLALVVSMDRFFTFLYLLGAIFVPLFAAVLADHLRPARPVATLVAWLAGFVLYQWIRPTGPEVVTDLVAEAADLVGGVGALGLGDAVGASLPAFVLAFLVRVLWPRGGAGTRRLASGDPRRERTPRSEELTVS